MHLLFHLFQPKACRQTHRSLILNSITLYTKLPCSSFHFKNSFQGLRSKDDVFQGYADINDGKSAMNCAE